MTFKQAITLRNIMIILCICMLGLLGSKALMIRDKILVVQEAEQMYTAGDLIAAERLYRQAADNFSIHYKEEQISGRLTELAPITAIRSGLDILVRTSADQLVTKDFSGFMESYASLLSLKSKYFISGGPYESFYRELSEESGISVQLTNGFRQFKDQFLAELATGGSGDGAGETYKWNLLLIPDAYYGGQEAKDALLAAEFEAHDVAGLKALAAAGSFQPMLDSALSMAQAYSSHSYTAPWVQEQAEESARLILDKDLEGDNVTAFAGHAVMYRSYAAAAGLDAGSSKVLASIERSTTKLLSSAARLVRGGQYAEAIQLYSSLTPLQDTSTEIAAAQLAWNTAEPVRLLPGGNEEGKYVFVTSVSSKYGAKIAVAGIDNSGRLYYADLQEDGITSTRTGDVIPDFGQLSGISFDDRLAAVAEVPVVVAQGSRGDGRTDFTAYQIKPEGISVLFTFAGDSYELQAEDASILVANADTGDGVSGETGVYTLGDGSYQFAGIRQVMTEPPLISAFDLELYPYQTVKLGMEIYIDNSGRSVGIAEGRYFALQGAAGSFTGSAVVKGQYLGGYEYIGTETGEQYVPVFVVDSLENLSSSGAETGTDMESGQDINPDSGADLNPASDDTGDGTNANTGLD
ncbi:MULTISPECIES: hypothetical protein [unclassified Paenibacillus]|uniref:hypothetical protein n=1 Tax=unclassified Paenibacillus TaxID=185978 RepID=UPI002405D4AB|nr:MULTISPECIES: hypothetical protein [unclassified Paenibacillus]MDF9842471.1 hypothetical protein [Paenibacillus sp. PastF-2]MDF9849061.1 hypothetical protein [Paenibacillus sp. PastM-2]MDF9855631.1 hypothetical protein [Paenibacillus sp. PastF-1]MDH6480903.1 hypothetical protein [Paenibacillus sp. PastH-2]MDH6508325.1 hypothetical protein [Paenibacillus sp. PastM-3]